MSILTKEDFDQIEQIVDKKLDSKLAKQTKELKDHAVGLQEELARMVAEGFEYTNGRIYRVETRVTALELKVDDMNLKLDSFAPKLEVVELKRRTKRLEDSVGVGHF